MICLAAIQAPAHPPPVHPHDRALLRPLATLGKPKSTEAAVSFLRRTEYISSMAAGRQRLDANPLRATAAALSKRAEKRKSPEPDVGTPAFVKRKIEKSFAVARANQKDRSRVKHPTKKRDGSGAVHLVAAYPVLPDLEAFPDSGAYVTIKFTHNPVPSASTYDTRLLSASSCPSSARRPRRPRTRPRWRRTSSTRLPTRGPPTP